MTIFFFTSVFLDFCGSGMAEIDEFCHLVISDTNILIYFWGVLGRFQHCTGHITTGS